MKSERSRRLKQGMRALFETPEPQYIVEDGNTNAICVVPDCKGWESGPQTYKGWASAEYYKHYKREHLNGT